MPPTGQQADLRAADVCHSEHELEDAVSPGNDGGVGDKDGAGALLGVGDAAAGLHAGGGAEGTMQCDVMQAAAQGEEMLQPDHASLCMLHAAALPDWPCVYSKSALSAAHRHAAPALTACCTTLLRHSRKHDADHNRLQQQRCDDLHCQHPGCGPAGLRAGVAVAWGSQGQRGGWTGWVSGLQSPISTSSLACSSLSTPMHGTIAPQPALPGRTDGHLRDDGEGEGLHIGGGAIQAARVEPAWRMGRQGGHAL